jgi:hypothetical protein
LTKRDLSAVRGGGHDVADLDLVVGDDHAVDQELDESALLLERGASQARPHAIAEGVEGRGGGVQVEVLPGRRRHLTLLYLQRFATTVQLRTLALAGGKVHDVGQVGVQEPAVLALDLADCRTKAGTLGLELARQPRAALSPMEGRRELLRMRQGRDEIVPDELVDLAGRDVPGRAARRRGRPRVAVADVVGTAVPGRARGSGQAAQAAAHQRSQQVLMARVIARGPCLVLRQFLLDQVEVFLRDDRRHGDRDPLVRRTPFVRQPPADRLEG